MRRLRPVSPGGRTSRYRSVSRCGSARVQSERKEVPGGPGGVGKRNQAVKDGEIVKSPEVRTLEVSMMDFQVPKAT